MTNSGHYETNKVPDVGDYPLFYNKGIYPFTYIYTMKFFLLIFIVVTVASLGCGYSYILGYYQGKKDTKLKFKKDKAKLLALIKKTKKEIARERSSGTRRR